MNTGDENIVNDVYCLLLTIQIVCKEVRNTFLLLSMSNVYSHDKQSFQSGLDCVQILKFELKKTGHGIFLSKIMILEGCDIYLC